MGNTKREALELIQQLPDNSSFEDIQYHLYVREKVEGGLRDLKRRRTVSQKEAERRVEKVAKRVIWTEAAWEDLNRHVSIYQG